MSRAARASAGCRRCPVVVRHTRSSIAFGIVGGVGIAGGPGQLGVEGLFVDDDGDQRLGWLGVGGLCVGTAEDGQDGIGPPLGGGAGELVGGGVGAVDGLGVGAVGFPFDGFLAGEDLGEAGAFEGSPVAVQPPGQVGFVLPQTGVAAFVGAFVVLVGAVGVDQRAELSQPGHEVVVALGAGLFGDHVAEHVIEQGHDAGVGAEPADGAHRGHRYEPVGVGACHGGQGRPGPGGLQAAVDLATGGAAQVLQGGFGGLVAVDAELAGGLQVPSDSVGAVIEVAAGHLQLARQGHGFFGRQGIEVEFLHATGAGQQCGHHLGGGPRLHGTNRTKGVRQELLHVVRQRVELGHPLRRTVSSPGG